MEAVFRSRSPTHSTGFISLRFSFSADLNVLVRWTLERVCVGDFFFNALPGEGDHKGHT